VFIENLPVHHGGNASGKIDWKKSIGYEVYFIFEFRKFNVNKLIVGYITIIGYNSKTQKLTVTYKNNIADIHTSDLIKCKLSCIIKEDIYRCCPDKTQTKWVDLSKAPLNGKGVDWNKLINEKQSIPFRYDDIYGDIVIDKLLPNRYLLIKYLDYPEFKIFINNFRKCKLGGLLEKINYKYIYKNNDVIYGKYSNIKIIELIRCNKSNMRIKAYKYKCLKCGYTGEVRETSITSGTGCPVCARKKVLTGFNDITITDPWMIKYFQGGYDEAKLYSSGSSKKFFPVCPICGKIKYNPITINNLKKTKSIGCECSDGISYPEKFVLKLLQQLDITFEHRKSDFIWSDHKEYDFYIPSKSCIIEVNGEQHYSNSFSSFRLNARTLEEEQENDLYKKELAQNNNIVNDIIIDARNSDLIWMKNSIINSEMSRLFCLSDINWELCEEYAIKNLIKEVCNFKANNINCSTSDISKVFLLSKSTIIKYLKFGNELGLCVYNKNESHRIGARSGKNHPMAKSVICLTTNKIFSTEKEAAIAYGLKNTSHLAQCCKGIRKSCGVDSTTGKKLIWAYYNAV